MTTDQSQIVMAPDTEHVQMVGNFAEDEQVALTGPLQSKASLEAFDEYMAVVQRRAEKCMQLRDFIISKTTPLDWDNLENRPYLNIAGANKAAKIAIVVMDNVHGEKGWSEDEKHERSYWYKYTARFYIPNLGDSVWEIGRCSQRDLLFGTHKVPKTDDQGNEVKGTDNKIIMVRAFKPVSEVDEENIDKSAFTNLRVRGVRAITGLSSVTWEELERLAKITKDMIGKVAYSDSKGGAGAITKAEMREVFSLLEKHKVEARELQQVFKISGIKDLKQSDLTRALAWIRKQGETDTGAAQAQAHAPKTNGDTIAAAAAVRLREGMNMTGITDAQYKAEMGCLPQDTKKTDFVKAEAWINSVADGRAK